jgi:hypothetical protein
LQHPSDNVVVKSSCPLCGTRKAKRACPALARDICPVCCATKRQVEIACPPDCGYLSSSRAHPPAVVQRQQERDMRFLLPRVSDLTETQYRLFMLAQALIVQHARAASPPPIDHDVAEGLASAAATLETAGKGIIYEHRATSIPAQRIADEISAAIRDLATRAGSDGARLERDAAKALRALERAAREAQQDIPDSTRPEVSWLVLAARIFAGAQPADQAPEASKLVI